MDKNTLLHIDEYFSKGATFLLIFPFTGGVLSADPTRTPSKIVPIDH